MVGMWFNMRYHYFVGECIGWGKVVFVMQSWLYYRAEWSGWLHTGKGDAINSTFISSHLRKNSFIEKSWEKVNWRAGDVMWGMIWNRERGKKERKKKNPAKKQQQMESANRYRYEDRGWVDLYKRIKLNILNEHKRGERKRMYLGVIIICKYSQCYIHVPFPYILYVYTLAFFRNTLRFLELNRNSSFLKSKREITSDRFLLSAQLQFGSNTYLFPSKPQATVCTCTTTWETRSNWVTDESSAKILTFLFVIHPQLNATIHLEKKCGWNWMMRFASDRACGVEE